MDVERRQLFVMLENTANQQRAEGRYAEALALHAQAERLDPASELVFFNRGMVYFSLNQRDAMRADFERAEALAPANAEMLQKMSVPYVHLEQYDRAIDVLTRALAVKPALEEAWLWLARAYFQLGDDAKAYALLAQGLAHCPGSAELALAHALFLSRAPASNAAIDAERARFKAGLDRMTQQRLILQLPERQFHFMPCSLICHGRDDRELMERLAAFLLGACPDLGWTAPHCLPGKARQNGPIRIGFLLETAHVNTVLQFSAGIMEGLKRRGDFEVVFITNVPHAKLGESQIARMAHRCIHFSDNLAQARQSIAAAELDILVYLELGNYHMSYLLSFARLAPIQVVWGGFPVTTGVPNMDYFITARETEPEHPERHYTETPLFFTRSISVFKKLHAKGKPKPKRSYGLPDGEARNYVCPVMLHKLHPDMDDIFAELLARDVRAHVVLFRSENPYFQANMEARLKRAIAPEHQPRLVFLPFLPMEDFLHALTLADAVLDSLHYSFGTTAFIAFSVGVPFITHCGEFMRGRAGAFMYGRMGISGMAAQSREEYIRLALHMAANPRHRAAMSALIGERSGVLFDDVGAVDEFAEQMKQLHSRRQEQAA